MAMRLVNNSGETKSVDGKAIENGSEVTVDTLFAAQFLIARRGFKKVEDKPNTSVTTPKAQ